MYERRNVNCDAILTYIWYVKEIGKENGTKKINVFLEMMLCFVYIVTRTIIQIFSIFVL